MRAVVTSKAQDDLQLELFGLKEPKFPVYETADAIRVHGRKALAGVPAEDGHRLGGEGSIAREMSHLRWTVPRLGQTCEPNRLSGRSTVMGGGLIFYQLSRDKLKSGDFCDVLG